MGLIPLLIFGTGGHAREILGLGQAVNARLPTYQLMGWLDDRTDLRGNAPLDFPMLGKLEDVHAQFTQDAQLVIAIGNGGARKRIAKRLDDLGIRPATLV